MTPDAMADLLDRRRAPLVAWFARHGGAVARHESAEDLAQGVHLTALRQAESFEYRGEREFAAWLYAVARQHLARRIEHWGAKKREAGALLRITVGASSAGGVDPAAAGPGPATNASAREEIETVARVLQALPPRDRELLVLSAKGLTIPEMAAELSLTPAAAQRARHRAASRFRKIHALLTSPPRPTP